MYILEKLIVYSKMKIFNLFVLFVIFMGAFPAYSLANDIENQHADRRGYECDEKHVIILHGLGRTKFAMQDLADYIETRSGCWVSHNIDYPSRIYSVAQLSTNYLAPVIDGLIDDGVRSEDIYFVTHSLGGILVRQYLANDAPENMEFGRVVMLAPPNQGSEVSEALRHNWFFVQIDGAAGIELGTRDNDIAALLPDASDYELGVIAGDVNHMFLTNLVLPRPNDGLVTVESTKLEGMNDHIVLPVDHTFIMRDAAVQRAVVNFLNYGRFELIAGSPP